MEKKIIRPSLKVILLFFVFSALPVSFMYFIMDLCLDPELMSYLSGKYYITIIILALEATRRYFNYKYIFKDNKIIAVRGILSFHLSKNSVDYADIREIKINQSLLGRILDYGDLLISTASTAGIEIIIKKIDSTGELSRYINRKKAEIIEHQKNETDCA